MLSDNLKKAREAKKLSKAQLARILEIPYTTYNGYETQKKEPKIETLKKIAESLEVSVDYLIGDKKLQGIKNLAAFKVESIILETLKEKGISEEKFCLDLGFPIDTVYNWKTGASNSSVYHIKKIADYLEKPIEEFTDKRWAVNEFLSIAMQPSIEYPFADSVLDFACSEHEQKVVIAYRNQPEMRTAVDRILGVEKSEEPGKF